MDLIKPMLDLEVPTGLQLSPDGRSVVYSTRRKWDLQDGEFASSPIWLAKVGEEKSARLITSGYNDRLATWAPDSMAVAFVSDRGNRGKAQSIYLVGLEDKQEPRPLTPAASEGKITKLSFSPDRKHIAFISTPEKSAEEKQKEEEKDDANVWGEGLQYANLYLLEVNSGIIKPLFKQERHVDDFTWNDEGTKIAVATHDSPHIESAHTHGVDLVIVDVDDAQTETVCSVPLMVNNLVWAGSSLYFIGNFELEKDSSGLAVFAIDLWTDNHSPKRVAHGQDDCPQKLSRIGRDVLVLVQRGMEAQLRILNGKVLFAQKKSIIDFDGVTNQDGGMYLVTAHGDLNHPTEVFSMALADGVSTQLSDHGIAFPKQDFGQVSFVECQSFDGKELLEGMFITPAKFAGPDGKPTRPLPTYVVVHGGPYFHETDSFDSGVYHLYRPSLLVEGYAMLIPNYRGGSGRGSRFASYSRGGMGLYDEPDIVAMTQYAITQGFADKHRLVVGGWSQGGFLSYLSAVRNGKHGLGWRFKGAIPGAGVTDWDTMTLTSDVGYEEATFAGVEMWDTNKDDLRTRSGSALWEFKQAAQEGRIPAMLMLHGEADERVPVSQAWGFRRALVKADLPFELVTYPREGHRFKERKHIEDLVKRVLRFIAAHLSEAAN